MKIKKTGFIAAALACVASVASAVVSVEIEHDTSGVRPGYWTSDFEAAKALADEKHIPLLSFWGYEDCAHCAKMKSNGLSSDIFKNWVKEHPIILVYTEVDDATRYKDTPVKTFTKGNLSDYPFMRCYWQKADGTLVSKNFSGNTKQMPYTQGVLAEQLVGTLNMYFGSWVPTPDYNGGYFTVTNMPNARLEAVVGKTKTVSIPMYRTEKSVATNKLQATSSAMATIVWPANVLTTSFTYTIPANATAGTTIPLKLYAADGKTLKSTSAINIVSEPEVSTANPKWLGESFDYGEWTMDYDAAKKKSGLVLAEFGGALWCPNCFGADASLFKSGSQFYDWAKRNDISLVVFDQGRSDGKTPAGTGEARLLTYAPGGSKAASGASYLSRKGLAATDTAVLNRIAQTTKYTVQWKKPDSTAPRMANPEMVLVKNDKVIARFNAFEAADKTFDVTENLARLNALLELDDGDTDDFFKTATQTLAVEASASGQLQINNTKKFYKLTNVPAGKVVFGAAGVDDAQAKVKPVLTVYDGSLDKVLATGEGAVEVTFANGANKYLSVSYFTENKKYGTNNHMRYAVTSAVTLVPSQTKATFKTTSGKVYMTVLKGVMYKLDGFTSYTGFTKNADGTYTATATAKLEMRANAGATVSYQIWTTGTVQFTASSAKKMESDGSGTVTVTRTGGSAGTASIAVSVDKGTRSTGRVSVSPATLTWADGDTAAKTVTYKITPQAAVNPDEVFNIALSVVSGSAALGSPSKFALTVSDTDDPVLPSSTYTVRLYKGIQTALTYAVSNIKENGRVTVNRDGNLPSGMKLNFYAGTNRLMLEGKPTKAGTFKFNVSITESRSAGKVTGKATAFTVVVADAASLKPGDKGYNAILATGTTVTGMVPVYGKCASDTVLAGTVELRVAKNGRVTAKFAGVNSAKVTLTGNITSIADDGTVNATLAKGDTTITVQLTSAGRAVVKVTNVSSPFGTVLNSDSAGAKIIASVAERSAYAGYYTVTLPCDTTGLAKGGETVPTGTGYVILKMNVANFNNKGRVNYSGVLPNGKAFSGASYFNPGQSVKDGATWGYLPIVINKQSAKGGVLVRVRKDAAKTYKTSPEVVLSVDNVAPYWIAPSKIQKLKVYGGCFERNLDFASCCQEYYAKETFDISCDTQWFARSQLYGALTKTSTGSATVSTSGRVTITGGNADLPARFSISRSTGVITGSVYAQFENGRKVRLTVKGVALPGWTDCGCYDEVVTERPFVSAAGYYNDRVNGKTTERGFAVEFK
ncbi:MAG: hypothetical protein J6U17_02230 [Kiritimatiellae bacterium]|nr:hypothetical protein [Kiritimatiellia bacterium]